MAWIRGSLALVIAGAGCTARAVETPASSESSDSSTTTASATTVASESGIATTSSTSESTGAASLDGGDAGSSTGCVDPDPLGEPCDVYAQDCPCGTKCVPWANDGGNSLSATKCSPIAPAPRSLGESCLVEGSWLSGIDDCDAGLLCWDVDHETNMGTCVAMCSGSPADPLCEDPAKTCAVAYAGLLAVCMSPCHPLAQDCNDGEGCYPLGNAYVCEPDQSGPAGGYGDEDCMFERDCDPGLSCAYAAVPGCEQGGCCSQFCDLSPMDDTQCAGFADGQTCAVPIDGPIGPRWADVGICSIP